MLHRHPAHDGAHDGPLSTPVVAEHTVYALGADGRLVAVGLHDGRERWSIALREAMDAPAPFWGFTTTPVVAGDVLAHAIDDRFARRAVKIFCVEIVIADDTEQIGRGHHALADQLDALIGEARDRRAYEILRDLLLLDQYRADRAISYAIARMKTRLTAGGCPTRSDALSIRPTVATSVAWALSYH